jgi:hypothetical protein
MSLYHVLDMPVPRIAYCAIHQSIPGIPPDEYRKTMKELHQRIAKETQDINTAYTRFLSETITRESQSLQNSLSHFLSTPISSDRGDVGRILAEAFERFKGQLIGGDHVGLEESLESRVFFVSSKKSVERRLLKNGKSYLDGLGFTTTKGHPEIYESSFIVAGAMNLDVLEHIVRDRLGIYSTTHGKHIKEFSGYSYGVYNMVFAHGALPAKDAIHKYIELTLYFSKPDVKYAPFRSGLVAALEKLIASIELDHVSLWQRKLGLGAGREFILRIISGKSEIAGEVVQWLNAYEEKSFARDAVVGNGSLVVKDLLFR